MCGQDIYKGAVPSPLSYAKGTLQVRVLYIYTPHIYMLTKVISLVSLNLDYNSRDSHGSDVHQQNFFCQKILGE